MTSDATATMTAVKSARARTTAASDAGPRLDGVAPTHAISSHKASICHSDVTGRPCRSAVFRVLAPGQSAEESVATQSLGRARQPETLLKRRLHD